MSNGTDSRGVRARGVLRVLPSPVSEPDGGRPLIGREREMRELRAALAAAVEGHGGWRLITGEAGIGKTRLAGELAAAAAGRTRVLWGRCREDGGAPAFWPWTQILREWARARPAAAQRLLCDGDFASLSGIVPELVPEAASGSPIDRDPDRGRFRQFDSVVELLRRAGEEEPLLLIFDDLHAADIASLRLLAFAAAELATMRLLVIGTSRALDARAPRAVAESFSELARAGASLPVRGLGPADVSRFVESVAERPPAAALVAAVAEATGGNPFFLDAVVRLLVAERRLDDPAATTPAGLRIPAEVREVIRRRLAGLGPQARELLQAAAVVGREFDAAQVAAVAGTDVAAALGHLDRAAAQGIVLSGEAPGRFGFVHALVPETLYHDLPPARRAALHRQVAHELATRCAADPEPHLAELARHFLAAAADGGGDPRAAMEWAERAGRSARARFAHEEAAAHFESALSVAAPSDPGRECDLRLSLGEARTRGGEPELGREAFRRAAAIAARLGDGARLARAALGVAWRGTVMTTGEPERIALLSDALATLPPGDSLLRVRLLARLAIEHYLDPGSGRSEALSRDALAVADRLGDPRARAHALTARLFALWHPDGTDERLVVADETAAFAESAGGGELAAEAHFFRFAVLLELGRVVEADRAFDAFAKVGAELRQPFYDGQVSAVRAMRAVLAGRYAEGEQLADAALALAQRAQNPNAFEQWVVHLFALRRDQGRSGEFVSMLEALVAQYPAIPAFRSGLALVLCDLGRLDDARAHFEQLAVHDFADLQRDMTWLNLLDELAQVCAALGDAPRAAMLYALLAPFERRCVVIGYADGCNGAVARYLGLLAATMGRHDDAVAHLELACALNLALGARPLVLQTQIDLAAVLLERRRNGDTARARQLMDDGAAVAEELGAVRATQRIEHLRGRVAEPCPTATGAAPLRAVLRRDGDVWLVGDAAHPAHVRATQGFQCLAHLLAHPGVAFHASELARLRGADPTAPSGRPAVAAGSDAGVLLDARARGEYRARLRELQAELEEADARHDLGHRDRLQSEIEALGQELARGVGLGGRERRAGSSTERARVNVQRVVRLALQRIETHAPDLARYLTTTIRTGTWCSYTPDSRFPVTWQL